MTKRVLLPLDGTEHAEVALRALPGLSDPGDEIVLLSISEPRRPVQAGMRPGRIIRGGSADRTRPDFPVYAETDDQVIQGQLNELQSYLQTKATQLKELGFSEVELAVEVSEDPAGAIVDVARRVKPTFILMVRTTSPGIGERVFGTVAQRVIREDVAPVMIVPGK